VTWRLIHADCIEAMREMDEASVDAIVTDPPYGLGFMGKTWDSTFEPADIPMRRNGPMDAVNAGAARQGGRQRAGLDYQKRMARDSRTYQTWTEAWATEALRVLKPGGHLLAFGGTRTFHRLACALEDAGFEIRDTLAWMYGSGFPKSLDVSKAIDKAAGAAREVVRGHSPSPGAMFAPGEYDGLDSLPRTAPATPEAERWQGWGTALKPSYEPVVLARKPLAGTVAQNVQRYGTGALNIDAARIDPGSEVPGGGGWAAHQVEQTEGWDRPYVNGVHAMPSHTLGRWPANAVLDEEAARLLDEQTGERPGFTTQRDLKASPGAVNGIYHKGMGAFDAGIREGYNDSGGASRFFYVAKAGRAEREIGQARNHHPTVKPVALMQWLCRLVTPPGGLILDPFTGSGSTGMAALREGFDFVGIEREADYVEIARARIQGDAPLWNIDVEVEADA
jgi:DNA modification methylase